MRRPVAARGGEPIAVIGMAGRFPGADDVDALWRNLRDGVESVTRFTPEELLAAGLPRDVVEAPGYVPVRGMLRDVDRFDAKLFHYRPREAALLDPQSRLLLETGYQALEAAGHLGADQATGERTAVFVGTGPNTYLLSLVADPALRPHLDPTTVVTSDRDTAATRLAYKLGLTGPALTVQSACSTSLSAVHLGVTALQNGECDTALVGGATVTVPQRSGYRHEDGSALSRTGRTRPFDADADGTVPGSGVALVVLRRLSDALADRDQVHAVILGSALTNDGSDKLAFTAPSPAGQAAAIVAAHRAAAVDAETISYVETHGTATRLGDPVEIEGLLEAFRHSSSLREGSCLIGSVKSNVGHLDTAAGVTALIKVVLALRHRTLPPSLHYTRPNPLLNLERTPFRVATELTPWERPGTPLRAGVSSFGVGGTNAHVVLEEAPAAARPAARLGDPEPSAREHIVLLSARSRQGCATAAADLAAHLDPGDRPAPEVPLLDLAGSSAVGRGEHPYRWYTVAGSVKDLVTRLTGDTVRAPARAQGQPPRTVFCFPGAGGQYPGLGSGLYGTEPVFRQAVDRCAATVADLVGHDLAAVVRDARDLGEELHQPVVALPLLFTVEYALTRLLDAWGVRPDAMLGHSMGEYVAACVAGTMTPEDALRLLHRRAELGGTVGEGAMLLVPLPEDEVAELLRDGGPGGDGEPPAVTVAAVNAPDVCVLSGRARDVHALAEQLRARGLDTRVLAVPAPGHSPLLDPVLPAFRRSLDDVPLRRPRVPWVSNVTGTWITDEQATDPEYWVRHLRSPVRFADGAALLLREPANVLVLGPGRSYVGWLRRQPTEHTGGVVTSCVPERARAGDDRRDLLEAVGAHWASGGAVDWRAVFAPHRPHRTTLPPNRLTRRRHWALRGEGGWQWQRADADTTPPAGLAALIATDASDDADGEADEDRSELDAGYVAPRTDTERLLVDLWREHFGIARIGVHDDFFSLGGDSLLAVRLAARVRQATGVAVQPGAIVTGRTVARLAAHLDGAPADTAAPEAEQDRPATVDLAAEAARSRQRMAELRRGTPASRPDTPRWLLTGATGFLGPYLLHQLLEQQPHDVTVLLRATSPEQGLRRLHEELLRRSLWHPSYARRLTVVPGDLREADLGLGAEGWRRLAASVTAVVHGGAEVNFVRPYDQLAAANVHGTEALLRLAAEADVTGFHHLSTLGVLHDVSRPPEDQDTAQRPLAETPGRYATGYIESKWVAEHAVAAARRAGLPATVYRIGMVAGDAVTGWCNPDDLFWRTVHTCVLLGLAPQRQGALATGPVDAYALALASLVRAPGEVSVHHLSPEPVPWRDVWQWVREAGHPLREVPFDAWADQVARRVAEGAGLPLAPLVSDLARLLPGRSPRFDSEATAAQLARDGVALPAYDRRAFTRSLRRVLAGTGHRT